jgi:hypothetical protein
MIDDPDIIRAAKLLINRHGERAASCANRRAEDLLFRGDIEASELWRQIVEAIKELTRRRRGWDPLN